MSSDENLWKNPEKAQKTLQELETLKKEVSGLSEIETTINNLAELSKISGDDQKMDQEITDELKKVDRKIVELEKEMTFSGKYDSRNVILSIHSGTGGVDAQDWAEMLLRMYLRFAERKNWSAKIISESRGQEAGIKSATLEIKGKMTYGNLCAEAGIHRLVRLSPFNANNLRQTSFALVEVLPEIDSASEASEIDPKDLRIDTYRSGGAGGQSVNKTSSAVRITHLPTGITTTCQSERSQLQNKEKALVILKSKLFQKKLESETKEKEDIKGEHASVQWGSQIRSYVLHPYQLVKDHRTKVESKNPADVLDGNLEMFIEAYLGNKCSL
jgi:peptide chain release factor 2